MHPFTRSPSFLSSLAIAVGLMLFVQPAVAAQTAPTFDDGDTTTLSIAENHADTATVGRAAATDADRDTLTYSLVGADAGTFTIDGNGDIKVVAGTTLDFETRSSYSVTAHVTDGKDPSGGDEATATTDDEISVAINVIDMAEAPGKPRAPWVLGSGSNSVRAGWREPSNTGPPIVDYDVQYRMSGEDDWRTEEHDGAHDHNLIPNLIAGAIYEVRVRASNAEGTGDWSDAGRGTVLGASISSVEFTNKPSQGYFAIGGHIEVTVRFNQPVTVVGTPRIKLNLAAGGTRKANYISGSPGTELVFQYTLADGDDSGGASVSVDANALDADGAERVAYIRVGTADVDASHDAVSSGRPAEAHRPRITGVRWDHSRATVDSDLDGNNDTIVEDGILEIFIHFDREDLVPVFNSDAEIDIEVGSATHSTRLHLFTDSMLVFHHRVAAGDMDGDGVTVKQVDAAGNLIRLLNDAKLTSPPWKGNNDAILTFAETHFPGLKVRGTNAAPRGSDFTRSTDIDADITFAAGDFLVTDSDGDPLKEIRLVTLPTSTQGALELGGAAIASADLPKTVTRAQLSSGDLVFDPATGFAGRATFEFKVVDPFGAASGATRATIEVESASQVLAFEAGGPKAPTALSVAENNAPGAEVGTVAATDPEGDPLTYSLDEASDAVFDINGDGRITVAAANALDYEATATYAVTVSASDGTNTATHSLTIFVTNVEEPPGAPTGVTAVGVASAATNLSVTWSAPTHIGVRLDGYDVEYRRTGSTAWTAHGHDGTGTATTIANLDPATEYDVQVRAKGDGNSAWASGRGRTAGVSAGNRAPRVLEWHNGACRVMPDPTKTRKFRNSPAGTLVNSGLLTTRGSETTDLPSSCARGVFVPIFDDQDGDALTYTLEYERPDRVVSGLETPFVRDNRVWHQGVAEFEAADMRVKVTATDPHGASAFAYLVFQVGTYANVNGAPSFGATTVPNQNVVRGRRMAPLVLPAATGGDPFVDRYNGAVLLPIRYRVSGLPAGLFFDAETRTVWGEPSARGSATVTYTAFDSDAANGASDEASLSFAIKVEEPAPTVTSVAITSTPSIDADGDGANDTYGRGDDIEVAVTWSEPVTWNAPGGADLRIGMNIGGHGRAARLAKGGATSGTASTLRFRYPVVRSDTDTDGVSVTTTADGDVVALLSGATLKDAEDRNATRRYSGSLSADANHKVDGARTGSGNNAAPLPPVVERAAVDGATLTITFDEALATPRENPAATSLRYALFIVRNAVDEHPNRVSVSGRTVTMTLYRAVTAGERPMLNYRPVHTDDPLRAADDGAEVAQFLDQEVEIAGATGAPELLQARVLARGETGPATVQMMFDEALDGDSRPPGSAFSVSVTAPDDSNRIVGGTGTANVTGHTVTVRLAAEVFEDDLASVSYDRPEANPIRDADGNEIGDIDRRRADIVDRQPPSLVDGSATGTTATLYYSEPLDAGSVPAAGDFTFTADGGAVELASSESVTVSGSAIELTLATAAAAGQSLAVTYTPGADPIQDLAGNDAAGLSAVSLTNAGPGDPGAPTVATTTPAADGAQVTVTFDQPLDPESVPTRTAFALELPPLHGEIDPAAHSVADVSIKGARLVLHLNGPVQPCDPEMIVRYEKPQSRPLRNLHGTDVEAFAVEVANARAGRCANMFSQARIIGERSIGVGFGRSLQRSAAPSAAEFTAAGSGGPLTVQSAEFSSDDSATIVLRLDRTVAADETATVTYEREPGRDGLWDVAGNQMADFADEPVTTDPSADAVRVSVANVADARANEAAGATLDFVVSLDAASARTATVDYATADGSAKAGEDYTAASGTLTFAVGETSKTVSVAVLDDAVDEGLETLRLRLSNARGARLGDGKATGTIQNADPLPKAWLARFARAAADDAVDAIDERLRETSGAALRGNFGPLHFGGPFGTAGSGSRPGAHGERLPIGASTGFGDGFAPLAGFGGMAGGYRHQAAPGLGTHPMWGADVGRGGHRRSLGDLLVGSAFKASFGSAEENGGRWLTAWGRAAKRTFQGEADGIALDGDLASYIVGADAAWSRWLAGVAVSHSLGTGRFGDGTVGSGGALDSVLTTVLPYLRYEINDRLTAWGAVGFGGGTLDLRVRGSEDTFGTDVTMRNGALGARGVFLRRAGGLEIAGRLDARMARIVSDAAEGPAGRLAAASSSVNRLRLVLEGTRPFELAAGRTLTPTLEVGLRRDGGDAETGAGAELGGALAYADPSRGLTVEVRGRTLLAHADDAYREWGASASVRLDPGDVGRGLSLTLSPEWGASGTGGTERIWSTHDVGDLAHRHRFDAGARLAAELGYGLAAFRGRGAMTPFLGMRTGAGGRDLSTGVGWTLGQNLRFGVEATRRTSATAPPEHGVRLQATARW